MVLPGSSGPEGTQRPPQTARKPSGSDCKMRLWQGRAGKGFKGAHLLPLRVEEGEQDGVAWVVWPRGHPEAAPNGQETAKAEDEDEQGHLRGAPDGAHAQLGVRGRRPAALPDGLAAQQHSSERAIRLYDSRKLPCKASNAEAQQMLTMALLRGNTRELSGSLTDVVCSARRLRPMPSSAARWPRCNDLKIQSLQS